MGRLATLAGLSLAVLALAGCGFTPLYGTPGVSAGLAAIAVQTPEGRTGQLIREHLDDALGRNAGTPAAYRLGLSLGEQRYPRGVRVDNVATRYEYVLVAAYTLTSASTGATSTYS